MKVAVYSGSFNPLHVGHMAIMEYLTRTAGFDCVYLVVSPQNPFKDASNVLSGAERYAAAVEAVKRHPGLRVRVDDIELGMDPPHYTIRTLDALRHREKDNSFTLVVGADNLPRFSGWRDYRRILLEYGVVVFPREGFHPVHDRNVLKAENPLYRIKILKAPMVNVSSTEIREGLARGEDMSGVLM